MRMRYVVEVLRLKNGVRLPLMLNAKTQMPHGWAMDYSLAKHLGKPINTSMASARAVAMFHSWADENGIDLDHRFDSGNLFSTSEITLLGEFLWIAWSKGPTDKLGSHATGKLVAAPTQEARAKAIINYIKWRSSIVSTKRSIDDPLVELIGNRLKTNIDELEDTTLTGYSRERGYLTDEQCERLFQIVRPNSPDNPFQERCRNRNFFLFLFYYEIGARRAEALVLKSSHLTFGPRPKITITFTPDDPKDPRINIPSVKTFSRTLPMSPELSRAAEAMLRDRVKNKNMTAAAKKTPFIVLSSTKGTPLTVSSIDRMFETIRDRFPDDFPSDFGPHHLRRSWNYRFSKICKAEGMKDKQVNMIKRYLMGWSKTSKQVYKYNGQFIEEESVRIMTKLQDDMFG
jgi:integrase